MLLGILKTLINVLCGIVIVAFTENILAIMLLKFNNEIFFDK